MLPAPEGATPLDVFLQTNLSGPMAGMVRFPLKEGWLKRIADLELIKKAHRGKWEGPAYETLGQQAQRLGRPDDMPPEAFTDLGQALRHLASRPPRPADAETLMSLPRNAYPFSLISDRATRPVIGGPTGDILRPGGTYGSERNELVKLLKMFKGWDF